MSESNGKKLQKAFYEGSQTEDKYEVDWNKVEDDFQREMQRRRDEALMIFDGATTDQKLHAIYALLLSMNKYL